MSEPAITAHGLAKSYGDVVALDGIDLEAREGTVLGLLGPNGAGKTTAVRILATLLKPDAGTASVAGCDVVREAAALRARIGLAGQNAAVDENLTGFENLEMVGRLYHLGRATSRERATELLERFDLEDAGGRVVKTYSGGMRRRLDLGAALVARPPVLFLDEPTTGLDPRSRRGLGDTIEDRVSAGTTVLWSPSPSPPSTSTARSASAGVGSVTSRRSPPTRSLSSSEVPSAITLPGWLQTFADVNPFTIMVNATRALWLDAPAGNAVWGAAAWSVGLLIVFAPLAVRTYRQASTR